MGKTFRRNDFRRPKKDRSGNKSRRQQEYEEKRFKFRPQFVTEPEIRESPDEPQV